MKIAVLGAGSIGCYLGGSLLAAGIDVQLIGRARLHERIARHGLTLTDLQGRRIALDAAHVPFSEDVGMLSRADLILVTVKSADTASAAELIQRHATSSAVILSLQNGVGNADLLRIALPAHTVLGGMVPFNVVQMPDGRFHRGTAGDLMVEASAVLADLHGIFLRAHLPLIERSDFTAVQWGKLLLNLNNAVNALSGLPLKAQLSQRAYRRCVALLIDEALDVLDAAAVHPATVTRIRPQLLPPVMRLPDFAFTRLAGAMLKIDPEARSSMWEDLQAGRRTEVDYLNGAVVKLAQTIGLDAPANRRIVELVHAVEAGTQPALDGDTLYCLLTQRR